MEYSAPPTYAESQASVIKNDTFTFGSEEFDISVYGTNTKPLFRAADVAKILGLTNINANLSDENKYRNDKDKVLKMFNTPGGKQKVTFVTRTGLYKLLFASKKEIAIKFQDWVCDVLEKLLTEGSVSLNEYTALNEKVQHLEKQNEQQKALLTAKQSRQRANNQKNDTVYIFETNMGTETERRPNAYKIGRTTNERERRLSAMRIGNPNIKSIAGIRCIDGRIVEETCKRICKDYNIQGEFFDIKKSQAINLVRVVAQFVDKLICTNFDEDDIANNCTLLCENWFETDIICENDDELNDIERQENEQKLIEVKSEPPNVAPKIDEFNGSALAFIDEYLEKVDDYQQRIRSADIMKVFKSKVGFRNFKMFEAAMITELRNRNWEARVLPYAARKTAYAYTNIRWTQNVDNILHPQIEVKDFIRLSNDIKETDLERIISDWIIQKLVYVNDHSQRIALIDIQTAILNENPQITKVTLIGKVCDRYLGNRYKMDVRRPNGKLSTPAAYSSVKYRE